MQGLSSCGIGASRLAQPIGTAQVTDNLPPQTSHWHSGCISRVGGFNNGLSRGVVR